MNTSCGFGRADVLRARLCWYGAVVVLIVQSAILAAVFA